MSECISTEHAAVMSTMHTVGQPQLYLNQGYDFEQHREGCVTGFKDVNASTAERLS